MAAAVPDTLLVLRCCKGILGIHLTPLPSPIPSYASPKNGVQFSTG